MKLQGLLCATTFGAATAFAHLPSAHAGGSYSVSMEVSNVTRNEYGPGFTPYYDADLDLPWGLVATHNPCYLFTSLPCHGAAPPLRPLPSGTTIPGAAALFGSQIEARKLLWAANHGSHVLTVYDELGRALLNGGEPLTVAVEGAPTGIAYNAACEPTIQPGPSAVVYKTPCDGVSAAPTRHFDVSAEGLFAPSFLLIASRDGKVYGWNPVVDPEQARVLRDDSAAGADYLGLTLDATGDVVYLADFHNARIVAYDRAFRPLSFTDRWGQRNPWISDPSIPPGFAPSNVALVNGQLIVTYGKQSAAGPTYEAVGPTFAGALYSGVHGYVVAFTIRADGTYAIRHLDVPSQRLDAPWGIALAPSKFGNDAPTLYVGNFGDGAINAFDSATLEYLGRLGEGPSQGPKASAPIRIPGLRGLEFKPMVISQPRPGLPADLWWETRLFYNASLNRGPGAAPWSVFGFIAPN